MTTNQFCSVLESHPGELMHWMLPNKSFVPRHYHITEVGRVQKDFIDCGGTVRSLNSCLLQVWVADDADHRLDTTKLLGIMKAAGHIFKLDDLPMEVEYEDGSVSQYPIGGVESTPSGLLFYLGTKHTECLAPEKCGVGKGCCR